MNSSELLAMFRDEAYDRLDRMVETLLAVERGGSRSDGVDELFRHAHSIKGGAGMLGLDDVYDLANTLEDRLADARDEGDVDPSLVEPLLQSVDGLRGMVAGATGAPGETAAAPADAVVLPDEPDQRSIRVDPAKVDRLLDAVGESVLQHRRIEYVLEDVDGVDGAVLDRGDVLLQQLQDTVIQLRTLPLSAITGPFPRRVRDLAAAEGKHVEFAVEGAETQLDRVILDGAAETIGHLLRNAVGHGIETPEERHRAGKPATGRVWLHAEQRGGQVAIEIGDDGSGVAPSLVERARRAGSLVDVLAEPGLSTAGAVTELAGRGVGLDAVRSAVDAVGGDLEITSEPGRGTTVVLLLPVSLVLLHVLLVECSGVPFGVPLSSVGEVASAAERLTLGGRDSIEIRGESIPIVDPVAALGGASTASAQRRHAVVISVGGRRAALACDRVTGEEEILVKPVGPLLAGVPGYLGAAIMRDGRIAMIVDPGHLASAVDGTAAAPAAPAVERPPTKTPTVLVVDDQFTVRELQRSILEASGYQVRTARDGREAWDLLVAGEEVDLMVTDIEMPEMDGLQLLESVRRLPERASLPVVVVTSRAREDDERRGLEAGADAYIVKERFDQRILLDTVERLVAR